MNLLSIELRADLYERADCGLAWLNYVRAEAIDLTATYPFIGILAVTRVKLFPGRRFDFDDDGIPAAVCEVISDDAETVVDLVAWPLHQPSKFATALGVADGLGTDQVRNPASYFAGQHLTVHRTPLRWLKAGCRGTVILNFATAPRWLGAALGSIAGEDLGHARELARLLHPYIEPSRVLAPLDAE